MSTSWEGNSRSGIALDMRQLVSYLVFNSTFSTNGLYRAIGEGKYIT